MPRGANIAQTLCWDCAKACGRCSWSDHWKHRPVKGWTAVEHRLRVNKGNFVTSYLVTACPEFEKDGCRRDA